MHWRRTLALPAAIALLTVGCFSSGASGGAATQRGQGRSPLSAAEIRRAGVATALDAIQRLRPEFLVSRAPVTGANASGYPAVYVDGAEFGTVVSLKTMSAETIAEIRWISPEDATTRWGTNYPNGVILVTTKR
ncbi:MAG TPA: hypothetical protein VFW98_01130 [Gemmatimonadaceae bacterium]|nr:hypothetical protein [Gemmatimonadaceae bacterium]